MSQNLKICLFRQTSNGIIRCKNINLRERLLRSLFGEKQKLMILIPGDSVESLEINKNTKQGGCANHEQNQTYSRSRG